MNDERKIEKVTERAADVARESKERVATAWAEIVEAAKTDPKARAFLAAFGMLEAPAMPVIAPAVEFDGSGDRISPAARAGDGAGPD